MISGNEQAAGTPTVKVSVKQIPGCLPQGFDLDSLLTVEQFAVWRQKDARSVRDEMPRTPGRVKTSRKDIRIHPRTYLEKAVRK